jgi:hypothetical protein
VNFVRKPEESKEEIRRWGLGNNKQKKEKFGNS